MLAYKFRLYLNKEEERKLLWTKEVCYHTYNRFLELYCNGEHDRGKPRRCCRCESRPMLTRLECIPRCSKTSCIGCSAMLLRSEH